MLVTIVAASTFIMPVLVGLMLKAIIKPTNVKENYIILPSNIGGL
jgi:hypothetical protein